jgi:hypothetical protein
VNLERDLAALRDAVDWPETPDIAARLQLPPRRASYRRRAIAVVLALIAGAAAVPEVRAAVGKILGFAGGERIERVEEVPGNLPRLDLGAPVSLDEARRRAGFRLQVPAGVGKPAVRLGGALGDATVSILLDSGDILSQRPGQASIFAAKQVEPQVEVRFVRVGDVGGAWIDRGPRQILVMREDGTDTLWSAALPGAGVLLWDRDGVALRLETRQGLDHALRVADSVR